MEQRLADTEAMRKIEGRFLNLFSRTFLKGAVGRPGPQIQSSVKTQFQSQTFQAQVDKIIDDIYIESVDFVDNKIKALDLGTGKKGGSAQAARLLSKPSPGHRRAAAKIKPLPITEEAVKASTDLSAEVSESIIRILKEEAIYEIHPNQLANRIKDLWGGSKYKATRFTRTFTADVSQNTAVHRYADMGIPELQFYAEIDDKTTDQCKAFHGTIIRTDSNDIGKFRPPLHHHCRSALLPVTSKSRNEDLLIENRDFTQQYGQHFDALPDRVDSEIISGVFEDIDVFNEKYRIDKFILDQDVQLRLLKLDLSVVSKLPEAPGLGKTGPGAPGPATPAPAVPEPPKFPTGQEIRAKISDAELAHQQKIKDTIQERLKLRDERYDFAEAYGKKNNYLVDEYNAGRLSEAEYLKQMGELEKTWKEIDALDTKIEALTELQSKLNQNSADVIKELIYIDDGEARKDLYKAVTGKLRDKRITQAKQSLEFINRVTSQEVRDLLPDLKIQNLRSNRAYTNIDNIIRLGPDSPTSTLLHETGHNFEFTNPKIKKAMNDFLERRTAGETAESLKKLTGVKGYKPNEIAKKDKFIDPYMGKIYSDKSTEVLSMGIAYLYSNPAMLIEKDAELFDLIVNVLRGKYD